MLCTAIVSTIFLEKGRHFLDMEQGRQTDSHADRQGEKHRPIGLDGESYRETDR